MSKALGALALAFGLLILIGSIVMFIAASSTVNDYETTMGQIARGLDEDSQREYESAIGMQICSGVGIVIGGIFSLVGGYLIFRPEPQKQQPQLKPKPAAPKDIPKPEPKKQPERKKDELKPGHIEYFHQRYREYRERTGKDPLQLTVRTWLIDSTGKGKAVCDRWALELLEKHKPKEE